MGGPNEEATAPTVAAERDDVSHEETLPASPTAPGAPLPVDATSLATVPASAYTILGEHGRGGLGRILRARDERTGRVVAIKEILDGNVDAAARFVREALVTANLQHPAIVPVYEVGRWPSGQPFYAMKLVAGRTLSAAITDALDLRARLALVPHVAAVADALAYAHEAGVIHRDLKPSNVLVGSFGETVVIDWGLAKRTGDRDELPLPEIASSETQSGSVMGTPAYMPPEQAIGEVVDARADVYAIGAMLYHLLAGAPPYADSKNAAEVITRVRTGKPPAPLASLVPDVAPDLAAIVDKAMARNASARYPTAGELAADLRAFMNGGLVGAHRYTTRQRIARWVRRYRAPVAIAALAAVALGGFGAYSIARIVRERDRAHAAESESTARLAASYHDRARVELIAGRPQRALPLVVGAMQLGRETPALRFLAARAAEPLTATIAARTVPKLGQVFFQLGSHDVMLAADGHLSRWDPEHDRVVWDVPVPGIKLISQDNTGDVLGAIVDGGARLLSTADGHEVAAFSAPGGGKAETLSFESDLRLLVATYDDGRVIAWGIDDHAVHVELHVPAPGAQFANLSRQGDRLAVGAFGDPKGGHPSTLWELPSGRMLAELCPASAPCAAPFWTRDGQRIVLPRRGNTGDREGSVAVVDRDGHRVYELITHGGVSDVSIVSDALVVATNAGELEVHALADGALRWRTTLPESIADISAPEDERRLSIEGDYGTTYVLDLRTGVEMARFSADQPRLLRAFTSSDGARIGMVSYDFAVTIVRAGDVQVSPIEPGTERLRRLAYTPDGAQLVVGSDDGIAAVYDVATGEQTRVLGHYGKRVSSVDVDASGRLALTASRDGTATLWDIGSGARVQAFAQPPEIGAASLRADGLRVATGGEDGTVEIWDAHSGKSIGARKMPRAVTAMRWSPDGTRLAVIDEIGDVTVWDADSLAEVAHLDEDTHGDVGGLDVAWSPDGAYLAPARRARQQVFLDVAHDRPITLASPNADDFMYAVHFDPSGQRLVMCGSDSRVRIWDLDGALRSALDTRAPTNACDFAAGGRMLVTGDAGGLVRVWDLESGTEIANRHAPDAVWRVTTSPRGDAVAAISDSAGMLWRIPPFTGTADELAAVARCASSWTVTDGQLVAAPTHCR